MQSIQNVDRDQLTRILGAAAVTIGVALLAWPAIRGLSARYRTQHPMAESEPAIDKSLKDTYPASDPPASRYFDIPVNRQ